MRVLSSSNSSLVNCTYCVLSSVIFALPNKIDRRTLRVSLSTLLHKKHFCIKILYIDTEYGLIRYVNQMGVVMYIELTDHQADVLLNQVAYWKHKVVEGSDLQRQLEEIEKVLVLAILQKEGGINYG